VDGGPPAYEPLDPLFHRDPYPWYRRLRDENPVHHTSSGYWVLSRFEDVFQATIDTSTYSSAQGLTFAQDEIVALGLKPTMVMMDRPQHSTFRRLISRGFTPRRVAGLEPSIRAFVRSRVTELCDAGAADLVEVLAGPLPSFVVATYLGVPEADRQQFGAWGDAIVDANATGSTVRDAGEALAGLYGYFTELIAWRRSHPGDDMLSDLVVAEVDGRPLELDKILGYCFVMIAGGNDTASGLLAGGVALLSEHPRQRQLLLDDPGLVGRAVEELLRLTSPVQGLSRTTTRAVDLHGSEIPPHTKVHLLYGSANRDEREFGPTADDCPSATGPTTASVRPRRAYRGGWSSRSCCGRYRTSSPTVRPGAWPPGPSCAATSRSRSGHAEPIGPGGRCGRGWATTGSLVVAGVDVDAGNALGVEHGEVVGIVLEGQTEVEAEGPEFVDGVALEPGHLGVVTAGPHDQEIPPQPVPLQPGQCLRLYPDRPAGQEDHLEAGVEQFEHPHHFADDRVIAAGVEKGVPVAPAPLDEVLATDRIGQDPVDVEDHRLAGRLQRSVAPGPVGRAAFCDHLPAGGIAGPLGNPPTAGGTARRREAGSAAKAGSTGDDASADDCRTLLSGIAPLSFRCRSGTDGGKPPPRSAQG
jgi:cytochrome P450